MSYVAPTGGQDNPFYFAFYQSAGYAAPSPSSVQFVFIDAPSEYSVGYAQYSLGKLSVAAVGVVAAMATVEEGLTLSATATGIHGVGARSSCSIELAADATGTAWPLGNADVLLSATAAVTGALGERGRVALGLSLSSTVVAKHGERGTVVAKIDSGVLAVGEVVQPTGELSESLSLSLSATAYVGATGSSATALPIALSAGLKHGVGIHADASAKLACLARGTSGRIGRLFATHPLSVRAIGRSGVSGYLSDAGIRLNLRARVTVAPRVSGSAWITLRPSLRSNAVAWRKGIPSSRSSFVVTSKETFMVVTQ